jgi:hypothetical protein
MADYEELKLTVTLVNQASKQGALKRDFVVLR